MKTYFSSRITPACAGKRTKTSSPRGQTWDHPRVRGKSAFSSRFSGVSRDHPRVRGEKPSSYNQRRTVQGSPPRARGKVKNLESSGFFAGITPACAGKSMFSAYSRRVAWDHPRVRGEKDETQHIGGREIGSPPRARGKASTSSIFTSNSGITPACAGKSRPFPRISPSPWDHPRVRGEKKIIRPLDCAMIGSPPRARGKAIDPARLEAAFGITPACAGKRQREGWLDGLPSDHPRVRGEKSSRGKTTGEG